jgi:hypothetical protein
MLHRNWKPWCKVDLCRKCSQSISFVSCLRMTSQNNILMDSIGGPVRFWSKMSVRNDYNKCQPYTVMSSQYSVSERGLRMTSQNDISVWRRGETVELEGREPIINTPPHLSWRSKRNSWHRAVLARGAYEEAEKIWYYPAVRIHAIAQIHTGFQKEWVRESWEQIECVIRCTRWDLSTPGSPEYIHHVSKPISVTPASP